DSTIVGKKHLGDGDQKATFGGVRRSLYQASINGVADELLNRRFQFKIECWRCAGGLVMMNFQEFAGAGRCLVLANQQQRLSWCCNGCNGLRNVLDQTNHTDSWRREDCLI